MLKLFIFCSFQVISGIVFASSNPPFSKTIHLLPKDIYYSHLEKIMEQYDQESTEISSIRRSRLMMQNEEPQPLRITLDFEQAEGSDSESLAELNTYVKKVLHTAFSYFESLIKIKRIIGNNTFTFSELKNCLGFVIKEDDYETGIPKSDLHLYTSFTLSDSELIASAGHCYIDPILKRPTFGRILLNLSHFKKSNKTNMQFYRDLQSIMHEILHILGFSTSSMNYWIDPETQKPYTYKNINKIISSKWFNNHETSLLSSKNVLRTAREYYGCESIEGMQFENQGGDLTRNQHWERSILMNELMTGTSTPAGGVFSIFTVALLRDTGYWDVVDENLTGKLFWGKNKGCDFYENKCQADLKYDEFENGEGILDCSFTGEGYGMSQSDPYSDGCNMIYPTDDTLCINYEQISTSQVFNQTASYNMMSTFSTQSRCFRSSISLDATEPSDPNIRCHRTQCNDEGSQITIFLDQINIILKCEEQGQQLLVENGSKIYGTINCPINFPQFCASLVNICPQFCSQNGYCLKGKCHCNKGYFGEDCSQACQQLNEDGSCVISCSPQLYANPDRTCQKDCPEGYYQNDKTHTCDQCHSSCSKCNGPSNQNCLTCHFLSYLHNNTCVSECESGYFKNKEQKICSRCAEGCISCSSLEVCDYCDQQNCYVIIDNLCKNTKCDSSCLTCNWDQMDKCSSCQKDSFMINGLHKCVDQYNCPKGTFPNRLKRECSPCGEGCTSCEESANKCLSCDESKGYTLFGEQCFKLTKCFSPCLTCIDENSPIRCASCDENYLLQGEECVQECSIGSFQVKDMCIKCDKSCETCSGRPDNCLSCTIDKFWNGSKCYSKCTEGQKWVEDKCIDIPLMANAYISTSSSSLMQFITITFVTIFAFLL